MFCRIFTGKMSTGQWTSRLSKPGFDARDPNQPAGNLLWSSDFTTFQQIDSGITTIPATKISAGATQQWTNVSCATILGTPLLLSVWTCSQYNFWNSAVTPAVLINSPRFSTGTWFVGGSTRVTDSSSTIATTRNAGLAQKVRDANTLAFTHNNTTSVTVRWQLFDAR